MTISESPESAPREAFARKVRIATLYVNKIVKHSDGYPVQFSEADIRTLLVNAFIQGMDEAAKPSPAEPSATLDRYRVIIAKLIAEWREMDTGDRSGGVDDTSIYGSMSDDLRFAACHAEGHDWQPLPASIREKHRVFDSRRCSKCMNLFSTVEVIEQEDRDIEERLLALRSEVLHDR